MDEREFLLSAEQSSRDIGGAVDASGIEADRQFRGARWINTRDGGELFAALSGYVSQQPGDTANLQSGGVCAAARL